MKLSCTASTSEQDGSSTWQPVTFGVLQVQAVVNSLKGSHNRVEAFVCLYARMVDKDNLWLVLYALKVSPAERLTRKSRP